MAGYNDETFRLQKLIDECALKDQMFADIDAVLRPEQRDVLHPESIRGRLGIDIFSSGTIWYPLAKALDFKTRDELPELLAKQYQARGNLAEEDMALIRTAAKEWARSFSDAYLQASADPIAQTSRREAANGMLAGWQKIEQAREAAKRQLAMNKALLEMVGPDSDKADDLRGAVFVYIPLLRPSN